MLSDKAGCCLEMEACEEQDAKLRWSKSLKRTDARERPRGAKWLRLEKDLFVWGEEVEYGSVDKEKFLIMVRNKRHW